MAIAEPLRRLGLLNVGGIGDNLLFTPVITTLRKAFAAAGWKTELVMMLERRSVGAVHLMPPVDAVVPLEVQGRNRLTLGWSLYQALRHNHLDGIISCGSSPLIAPVLWASGVPFKVGFDSGKLSHSFLTAPAPLNRQGYAGNMYHALAEVALDALGLPQPEVRLLEPRIALTPADMTWYRETISPLLLGQNKPTVLIHPGVSQLSIDKGIVKRWHPQRWAEAIDRLSPHATVLLAGGPDDAETITTIQHHLAERYPNAAATVISLVGVTRSLRHLAVVMAHMQLVLCTDSAPMHVAVGVETSVVALFGELEPARLLPPHPRYVAVQEAVASVRSQPEFLEIPVDTVVKAVLNQLGSRVMIHG
ncbi:MAG: glycosyltransferase family 9 protein [Vampirovibrionales bacterium]